MNSRLLQALREHRTESKAHMIGRVTRRRFIQATGSVVAAGAALGRQVLRPQILSAQGDEPLPIPGGSPLLSPFHVYGPTPDGSFDPIDAEPSTITNFDGVVGLAYIDGMVTRTHVPSGTTERFPFLFRQAFHAGRLSGDGREGASGDVRADMNRRIQPAQSGRCANQ